MRISEQIFPRPVALICTINKEGKSNVMTASFLMPISFEPKYLAFSISPKRTSFLNLKEIPEFTLNLLSKEMKKEAEICGSFSGKEVNKFERANLIIEKSKKVLPPAILGSKEKGKKKIVPISFECKVVEMKEFGDHFLVVGEVLNEWQRKTEFEPLLHYSKGIFLTSKKLKK
jgi:flavin reductase (DIM6/NTAB) family NADH-FMN oxidoreductase RutF